MPITFLRFEQLSDAQFHAVQAKWPTSLLSEYEYDFHNDGVTPYVRRPVQGIPASKTCPQAESANGSAVVTPPPAEHVEEPAVTRHAAPAMVPIERFEDAELCEVPFWLIDDSPTQPRTVYDPAKHEELRKSMVEHGWLKTNALLLRPKSGPACVAAPVDPTNEDGNYVILHPETNAQLLQIQFSRGDAEMLVRANPRRFERVFGHRRTRAAIAANLAHAPAFIQTLSDVEVLELQLVEGLKEELNAIDEAEHVKRLLALRDTEGKPVHSVETAAAKVGKEPDYLRKVLKLAELDGEARDSVASGQLGVSIGYLIGAIPNAEARIKAAHGILHPQQGVGPLSLAAAGDYIRREFTRDLRKAPFDTTDAELRPPAPACVTCNFNSAFTGEKKAGGPRVGVCGNIACYQAKEEVEWERWRAQHHQPENGRVALSRERCLEIFTADGELDWKHGLIDLAAAPHSSVLRDAEKFAEGPQPSWAELTAGRLTEILVARDPKGRKRELVQLETAKVAAESNEHLIFKTSPATKVERTRNGASDEAHAEAVLEQKSDDQAKQDETKEYNRRVTDRLLNTLDKKVQAIGHLTTTLAHFILRWIVDLGLSGMQIVEDCRATERGLIAEVLSGSDEKENLGAIVQLMVANYYAQNLDDTASEILDELGVSLQGAADAVKAEMDREKEKAAKAAAPKEPKKKKGKEKAEHPTPNTQPSASNEVTSATQGAGEGTDDRIALPKGCEWVSQRLEMSDPFEWSLQGACTNPELIRVEAAGGKKEKVSLVISVARSVGGFWFFGWNISTRSGTDCSAPNTDHTAYPDKYAALRDAASFLVLKVSRDDKVTEKTRERCHALAKAFGAELQAEQEAA